MALTKVNRGGLNTGISDSSNATFLTVDSSEQAVIKSEGGAATTSVQQGLTKAWAGIDSGANLENSFNVSSGDDDGTGNYGLNYTNNMSDANYSSVTTIEFSHNGSTQNPRYSVTNSRTTSSVEVDASYINSSSVFIFYDVGDLGVQVNGDLA